MMTETLANIHMNKQHPQQKKSDKSAMPKMTSTVNMIQMRENVKRTGSFVVGQKLRESKWFDHAEQRIFCAVVESGFIIEHKQNDVTRFGVAIWAPNHEKSKNAEHLTIYTLTENKGKYKIVPCKLDEFWPTDSTVRINNKSDKTETPLQEEVIKNQIMAAEYAKRKWHNSEHFAYFCRYGPVENHFRMRKITDTLRWNPSNFFLKLRSLTAK